MYPKTLARVAAILAAVSFLAVFFDDAPTPVQAANCPSSIQYGDSFDCTISSGGEQDPYPFSGSSGDRVFVRMSRAAGSGLYPKLTIKRPDGSTLCTSTNTAYRAEITSCLLDVGGTHSLVAQGQTGSTTGAYVAYIQRANGPENVSSMTFGSTIEGTLGSENVAWRTFGAGSTDKLFARAVDTSGGLYPEIRIFAPDGTVVCSNAGNTYFAELVPCSLSSTGTFSVVVNDQFAASGNYAVHLQRTNNPTGATAIAYGDRLSGSLTLGQGVAYSFTAGAGDRAIARMVDANGSANPYPFVRIFGPDGSLVCSPDYNGSFDASIKACPVGSGSHTVIAYDYYGRTESYGFSLQRGNVAANAQSIVYGSVVTGDLTLAEIDPFTFSGAAGDTIDLDPSTTSGPIAVVVRVHRPDGSIACDENAVNPCNLDATGTYSVFVQDWLGYRVGSYQLKLAGMLPPCDPDRAVCSEGPYDGDPVNVVTGDFYHSHTDVEISGKGLPLDFTRFYHSGLTTNRSLGFGWSHTYDWYLEFPSGAVTVFYPDGHAVDFVLSGGTYTPRPGVFDTLIQNGDGTYTLTTPDQIRHTFNVSGRLTSIKDRNNNTTSLSYTGSLLTAVTDAGGRTLTLQYDVSNRIWKITDPLPSPDTRTIEFAYDASGDLTQVKDVKGGTTVYGYSSHRMTTLTDSNGHQQVQNYYDSRGRVAEQTDAFGGATCFHYRVDDSYASSACPTPNPAPDLQQTIVVDPRGNKTTYTTDSSFRVTQLKDAAAGITYTTYDSASNVTCITDQRGKRTAFTYDSRGNVTQMIDADNTDSNCHLKSAGVKWLFSYTTANDIDLVTDPLGRTADYMYDSVGNVTRIARKDSGGTVELLTCIELNASGLPTATVESTDLITPPGATDPCTGNKTKFEYNSYGNLSAVVDPRFASLPTPPKTTLSPDSAGRVLTLTNELGHASTFTYDALNMVFSATDNLGNTATRTYDAKGNLKTVTDANRETVGTAESGSQCGTAGTGNNADEDGDGTKDDGCPNFTYNYDNGDRLIEVIGALGYRTTYTHDAAGNLTAVTNARRQPVGSTESGSQCGTAGTGNDTDEDGDGTKDDGCPSVKYVYDARNRMTSSTDALGRVTSYQYDAASNLTQRTDARGLVTKYFPDNLNRLDLIEYWNGTNLVGSVDYTYNAVGFRTQMVDSTGTTTYTPDALDRLAGVTFPGPKTVSYTYDDIPGGSAADYPGQRTVVTYPDNKTATYTYLANGAMSTVTDWLSQQTVYTYNDAGMLTKTQLPNGLWTDYGYDNADRLTSVVNKKPGPITISSFTYTLDAIGNRTQMVDLNGTHSYQYDPLYRLTQVTYPGPQTDGYTYDAVGNRITKNATSYTYDAADQMLTVAGVSYGYDNNGNQTSRGSDTFSYDHENRLTQAVISSGTSTNTYNGDGLRISHTVGGQTTNYTWDINGDLPVVLQDGTNTYVYGLDLVSATDASGNQTYLTYDGLGSTAGLANGSATVTDTYAYDAFGAVRSHTGGSANYWQFTGEQLDPDSGLQYLRARYYDPATGRFLGRDPFKGISMVPSSHHPYIYVKDNPINWSDPSGLCAPRDVACAYAHAHAIADFVYNEFLPWVGWVQDCRAYLLGAAALFGGAAALVFGLGIVSLNASLAVEGLEIIHVFGPPAAMGAGGLTLAVVASETALAACGEAGIFPEIPAEGSLGDPGNDQELGNEKE